MSSRRSRPPSPERVGRRAFLRAGAACVGGLAAPSVLGCGEPSPGAGPPLSTRVDLLEVARADVRHHGLFVELGSAAADRHTLGRWRTGWASPEVAFGEPASWVTASPALLDVHLDAPASAIVVRARAGAARRATLTSGGRTLGTLELAERWADVRVPLRAGALGPGHHQLALEHEGAPGERAFAVAWLRVLERDSERTPFEPPLAASLRGRLPSGEEALVLRAPASLSYYVEIPAGARLRAEVRRLEGRAAEVRVRVTDARAEASVERARLPVREGAPRAIDVDLSMHAGALARVELEVRGDARVALARPVIATPPARIEPGPPEARHVIVVLTDTLRADKLRAYSRRSRVATPSTDALAAESIRFERCQSPANWTKPACASLLTGRHPPSHGARTRDDRFPRSIPLVSELFRAAGFRTAGFIGNGFLSAEMGFDRGWDAYRNYIHERLRNRARDLFPDALAWIEANRAERMFVYVHTIDPHVPYDPPPADLRRYDRDPYEGPIVPQRTGHLLDDIRNRRARLSARDRRRLEALYDGEITFHDRWLGQFLERLRELSVLDSSIVVYTADHGEELFDHGDVGHGHTLYQELLHVPLMMRLPGGRAGVHPATCSLVDVTPTLFEAAGMSVPPGMEGRSLVPELRGAHPPATAAAFSSQWDAGEGHELTWAARIGDFKLRMWGPDEAHVTDLASDPRERRDAASPVASRGLHAALGAFLGEVARRGRAGPAAARDEALSRELCEQLRALGYLDVESCR